MEGVRAVIFDISGTVLDFGCRAPVAALVELFSRHGVTITTREARLPMGAHKRDHIRALLNDAAIGARWESVHGHRPGGNVVNELYAEFEPLQSKKANEHCDVIAGVPEVMAELRRRNIKVANTTGFATGMIRGLIPLAAQGGYSPDLWVCPDEVGQGRPAPWMIFHAARQLGIYPPRTFVKVGDTPADAAEGHAAGTWVVLVVRSGNEVGLSLDDLDALPPADLRARLQAARARLAACGPHYLIDTVADLMPVIDAISQRIANGETPCPADSSPAPCPTAGSRRETAELV
ncbi:MAG TPA: phosphonoacetaldehyde hydrolase [Candidatus Acidoferrales bacterium]|nr:phosphonoacetaldehyde hydrolase [Candidatus Acidoferrales bacterium]